MGKIRNGIPKSATDFGFCTRLFHGQRLQMFEPTTENEIVEIIKQYEVKTPVEDPTMLLKSAKGVIVPMHTILVLINRYLRDLWKLSNLR